MNNNQMIEKIAPMLTEVMINKIEELEQGWTKPWVTVCRSGMPRNIRGTNYSGANVLTLLFHAEVKQYKTPVFLTFNQAKEEELTIRKGEKSFPVFYYHKYMFDPVTRESIKYEYYLTLSEEEKKKYKILPILKYYNVFNVDQTDFEEKYPQRYAKFEKSEEVKDFSDGYAHPLLDRMLTEQSWYCPINVQFSNRAFYQGSDNIVVPEKRQFKNGVQFYSTLLHEMAHSTGHPNRLKREMNGKMFTKAYAREELVAELTAALSGVFLGVTATLQDNNAAYLKSWLNTMKQEPKFIFEVLGDVTKAAKMITGRVMENETENTEAA